ncbi:RsmB/NOP family class I SAM-dependent RNA methyltransferase [Pedobacter flavus]|uniref:RsmB/NOP family class I SAM-dependent RNA methyltransferase n=1 Tax=Pedobacter flavus TaxID=3113906 RepID=A0ABU7H1T6_9SPHI|nr:RsmB/NOP family class I SAM-dependent RNA methyltransferase [Pedobacter sp. VNH31]MEE1885201.1 RsmB/NOP family class I SAM-dependent RNA methyltransferase [Pedobacter sp. VNH31]
MKVEHQIRTFESILKAYKHDMPLHRFLPNYYKQHKKMGSSDRRWASRYVYSYFRLGTSFQSLDHVEKLGIADFLCNETDSLIVAKVLPELTAQQSLSKIEKVNLIKAKYPDFELSQLFPLSGYLSPGIDQQEFQLSHLTQPDVFIASTEKNSSEIEEIFIDLGIHYRRIGKTTLAFPNSTKLEMLIPKNIAYRIQDLSSQTTADFMDPKPFEYWWDCCAASGGKSLLLHQKEPKIQLLVSDNRESMINNLNSRFAEFGIKKYQAKVLDLLLNNDQILHNYVFDGIVLDIPCTGSGTWGRTPEMLTSFEERKIEQFNQLQKSISGNVVKYLKIGKPLIYITCSVFKKENEDIIQYLVENFPLKLEQMQTIKGYTEKADSMFVARLIKQ